MKLMPLQMLGIILRSGYEHYYMRETLVKLLGREPTLRECQAYLKWVRLREEYPELDMFLSRD